MCCAVHLHVIHHRSPPDRGSLNLIPVALVTNVSAVCTVPLSEMRRTTEALVKPESDVRTISPARTGDDSQLTVGGMSRTVTVAVTSGTIGVILCGRLEKRV